MTGLHTGHTPIRGNKEIQPEGQEPLPDETVTLPEVLEEKGYVTGAFGKWGLGFPGSEGDPIKQGFDEFYGYNCQRFAHNYYPYHLWHNDQRVELKENEGTTEGVYAPVLIQEKTLEFIEANKDQPFSATFPTWCYMRKCLLPRNTWLVFVENFLPKNPTKVPMKVTRDIAWVPTVLKVKDMPLLQRWLRCLMTTWVKL